MSSTGELQMYKTSITVYELSFSQRQSFIYVLQNRSSQKFWKFHRKPPVLKSIFNKIVALQDDNFIKKRHQNI